MSLKHAEIKPVSLKNQCAGQKRSAVIFVEAAEIILDGFNQAIGKNWQWSAI